MVYLKYIIIALLREKKATASFRIPRVVKTWAAKIYNNLMKDVNYVNYKKWSKYSKSHKKTI